MLSVRLIVILAIVVVLGARCLAAERLEKSPLFTYVNRPDGSFAWSKAGESKLESSGSTWTKIDLTSQTWHDTVWKHHLNVVLPKEIRDGSTVLLLIRNGAADDDYIRQVDAAVNILGMPIAVLGDIPNQPLWDKYEDDLMAHTFLKAYQTGDMTWPLVFPMTKSVVRAMDAIQSLAVKEWKAPVKGFVISGASKRGMVTFLAGAVDKRVTGIAPVTYDNLDMVAQMEHQRAVYGGYSEDAVAGYKEQGLLQLLVTPEGREFAAAIDPYTFRRLLTMPKMIILGTNDPLWTLESANLYFKDLPGDNHIHYSPNGGHVSPEQLDCAYALASLTAACAKGEKLQKLTWTYTPNPDGLQINIRPGEKVSIVRVWTASAETKDFRQAKWASTELKGKDGVYTYTLPRPKAGYSAIFGEAGYTENALRYTQSTLPRIVGAK